MYASVLLDSGIDKPLDYSIPEELLAKALPGMRVLVPVRGSMRKGILSAVKEKTEVSRVQPLAALLSEEPLISKELFDLAYWISHYYCTPLRKVLKSFLPPGVRKDVSPKVHLFVKACLSKNATAKLCDTLRTTDAPQAKVLEVLLASFPGMLLSHLLEKADVSKSPVASLVKKKIITCAPLENAQEYAYFQTKAKSLNASQAAALERITGTLQREYYATHLLYGITGSGKTEIYLQAIDQALALGKGSLLLVPEIALTSQTIERLHSRFINKIAILHHRLSDGERSAAWHQIQRGEARIVVGARSAVFSPIQNLGLIIVDEEHESSYKQTDEAPCYHARDVAVMRAHLAKATVILGSATPSLESYHNALTGKYLLSELHVRADQANLPTVTCVDMKKEFEKAKGFTLFSDTLLSAIKKRLEVGEQTLLFLNRRGYHSSQQCLHCGKAIACPHCDVKLTFHLGEQRLACHLCNYQLSPPPRKCPSCGREGSLKNKGAGTEQVERALHAIFPEVRTLRLDADTTRHKGSHNLLFKQFRSGKADILIGTQMIAKGLHFPSVTLVGVLNADGSLNIPDFRAAENTFQLIVQVSGRSGRGALPGEVIIQTSLIDHETIQLAAEQNYPGFYNQEIGVRKLFDYPPFTHLIKLTFQGASAEETQRQAHTVREQLIAALPPAYQIHPIVPCGHAKVKDQFRFQFLIKGEKISPLSSLLSQVQNRFAAQKQVRLLVDVDPLSTYF